MSVNDKPVPVTLLTAAAEKYLGETLEKVEGKQLARSTFTAYRRVVNTFLPMPRKQKLSSRLPATISGAGSHGCNRNGT
jgi:hypothetical protein